MKNIEDSLRNLWGNIKCINIWTIGVLEEEKEKRSEKMFAEMILKNFLYMGTSQSSSGRAESLIQDKPEMNTPSTY